MGLFNRDKDKKERSEDQTKYDFAGKKETGLYEFGQFPLSIPETKAQTSRPKTMTIASGGMVFAHNKILLVKSNETDMWSVPGGVVRFNESCEDTVTREIREELSLNIEIIDSYPFLFHFRVETEESEDMIFLVHFLIKVLEPARIRMGGDVVDYKWESIGSNFRDAYPNVKPAVDYFMQI